MKKVYCIIVTYNGAYWIEKCLDSVLAGTYPVHIIVIDNHSTDRTTTIIKNGYPAVELIISGTNLGFGQANNKGMHIALERQADYVFLLNQDAWIEPDTITGLVNCAADNPTYGIISPVHLNGKGTALDNYFADYFLQSDIKEFIAGSLGIESKKQPLIDTPFVNAAAWLITTSCLQKTGGFDTIFFHYGEDRNYAQRVIYWGFKIGIDTSTRACHDRDDRKIATDIKTLAKKEWIHFLTHACNIQHNQYAGLLIRRFIRHALFLLTGLFSFNRKQVYYNYYLAKKIISSSAKIYQSRKESAQTGRIPHLPAIGSNWSNESIGSKRSYRSASQPI